MWRPNYFGISSAAAVSTCSGLLAVIGAPDVQVVSFTVVDPAVAGVPAVSSDSADDASPTSADIPSASVVSNFYDIPDVAGLTASAGIHTVAGLGCPLLFWRPTVVDVPALVGVPAIAEVSVADILDVPTVAYDPALIIPAFAILL